MKVCIYGAGAIGGYLGARLSRAGVDVSLIARGPHLRAIQENGLTLREGGGEIKVRLPCSDNPEDFSFQDYVEIA